MKPPPGKCRIRLTIAFDGSAWHGWHSGRSGRGVSDQMEAALARLFPAAPALVGSSRTDAGVHALGLVAHFDVGVDEVRMPVRRLAAALNALLPPTIRVMTAARAPASFHARFGALAKQYRYQVWNAPVMNPLLAGTAWHVPQPLDPAALRAAAAVLAGCHDFRAFTSRRDGTLASSQRTVTRCDVRRRGPLITFVIEADGFLYRMCRAMVGTLVHAGRVMITPEEIRRLLDPLDPPHQRTPGPTAPAHGLVLWKVFYQAPALQPSIQDLNRAKPS